MIAEKKENHIIPALDCSKNNNLEISNIIEVLVKNHQNNGKNALVFDYNSETLNSDLLENFFNMIVEYLYHVTDKILLEKQFCKGDKKAGS